MKTNIINYDYLGNPYVNESVLRQLKKNGTYLPEVKNVTYNLQTEKRIRSKDESGNETVEMVRLANPVLVTKVWWTDGTTTTVKNSEHDKVWTETVKLSDGSEVEVATECSKQTGLAYAVVKRTCGHPNSAGEIVDANMGKIIEDIVKSAHDQNLESAKTRIEKAAKKAAFKKREETRPRNAKRYSDRDLKRLAGPILEALAAKLENDPDFVSRILGA